MSAARAISEALAAGVRFGRDANGQLQITGASPEMVVRLRYHRGAIIEVVEGDRCRHCAKRIDWSRPVAALLADGYALHHGCRDAEERERLARLEVGRERRAGASRGRRSAVGEALP